MTMLDRILETKRADVAARKATMSHADLDARIATKSAPRGFRAALDAKTGHALIAEVKSRYEAPLLEIFECSRT